MALTTATMKTRTFINKSNNVILDACFALILWELYQKVDGVQHKNDQFLTMQASSNNSNNTNINTNTTMPVQLVVVGMALVIWQVMMDALGQGYMVH